MKSKVKSLLDTGHIYLKEYRVIAITIVLFFMIETAILTAWYMENFEKLEDWQNAPVVGLILSYMQALKMALDHILKDKDE